MTSTASAPRSPPLPGRLGAAAVGRGGGVRGERAVRSRARRGPAPRAPTPSRSPSTRWRSRWPASATSPSGSPRGRGGAAKGTSLYDADVTILGGGGIATSPARAVGPVPRPGHGRAPAGRSRPRCLAHHPDVVAARRPARRPGRLPGPRPHPGDHRDHRQGRAGAHGPCGRGWSTSPAAVTSTPTPSSTPSAPGSSPARRLDVTDPEPLPDGHPLWDLPNAIITPHTADWPEVVTELLAARIRTNVSRFALGQPLDGVVDPDAGY